MAVAIGGLLAMSENKITLTEQELEVLAQTTLENRFNHTLHAYIDIAGSLTAGALLSQILYWFTPDKNGKRKVIIFKDGNWWMAKGRTEWWNEIRITEREYDNAIKQLVNKNLVHKKLYKWDSNPTVHIRPNYEVIHEEVNKWKEMVKPMIVEAMQEKGEKWKLHFVRKPEKSTVSGDPKQKKKQKKEEASSESLDLPWDSPNTAPSVDFTESVNSNSHETSIENDENSNNEITHSGKSLTEITSIDYRHEITDIDYPSLNAEEEEEKDIYKHTDFAKFLFGEKVNEVDYDDWKHLIGLAKEKGVNLEEVMLKTRNHFRETKKPIYTLVGALVHQITSERGWKQPISIEEVTGGLYESSATQEVDSEFQQKLQGFNPVDLYSKK